MRRITRTDCPKSLEEMSAEWTARWCERVGNDPSCGFNWPQYQNRKLNHILEDPLGNMTQQHCAFCDGGFTESLRTIEHFKPKRSFPKDAFSWSNLFPACNRCQGTKLEQWDDRLLKPDEKSYEFSDYFICDIASGAILPNPNASDKDRERAKKTIALYGLDILERQKARRNELRRFLSEKQSGEDVVLDDFNYRFFISSACEHG